MLVRKCFPCHVTTATWLHYGRHQLLQRQRFTPKQTALCGCNICYHSYSMNKSNSERLQGHIIILYYTKCINTTITNNLLVGRLPSSSTQLSRAVIMWALSTGLTGKSCFFISSKQFGKTIPQLFSRRAKLKLMSHTSLSSFRSQSRSRQSRSSSKMNTSSRFFADTAITLCGYGYIYVMDHKMNVIAMENMHELME